MERHTGRAIILSGGEPLESVTNVVVPAHAWVIAADSGLHHAEDLGLTVDLVVGDMDSVDPQLLAAAVDGGSDAERYPEAKDHTDLELAINAAIERGAAEITIIGAHTGRLDHLLGAMGLFAATAPLVEELVWIDGIVDVIACTAGRTVRIDGNPGDVVSLVPTGTDVNGVTTNGLRWRLAGDTLPAGSTRGISNLLESHSASVNVADGTLLIVHERTAP